MGLDTQTLALIGRRTAPLFNYDVVRLKDESLGLVRGFRFLVIGRAGSKVKL